MASKSQGEIERISEALEQLSKIRLKVRSRLEIVKIWKDNALQKSFLTRILFDRFILNFNFKVFNYP